jgi:PKD repeat protein
MLALPHGRRTAATFACLLSSAALAAAALGAPSAHAAYGQIGSPVSSYGTLNGQTMQLNGVGIRAGVAYLMDTYQDMVPESEGSPELDPAPVWRIQRFGADGQPLDSAPLIGIHADADGITPAEDDGAGHTALPGFRPNDFTVDPRSAGNYLYMSRICNGLDSQCSDGDGRLDVFDATTGRYLSSLPATELHWGGTPVRNTMYEPGPIAVDPRNGDFFVAGFATADRGAAPDVRGFPAGGGTHSTTLAATDAAPRTISAATPLIDHETEAGMAVAADGTVAMLSSGQYSTDGTNFAQKFVELFASADTSGVTPKVRARTAILPVTPDANSIAFDSAGNLVIGASGLIYTYDKTGTLLQTVGHPLTSTDDPATPCGFVGPVFVATDGGDTLATSYQDTGNSSYSTPPVSQIERLGDGGHDCGRAATFTNTTPKKGSATTFTASSTTPAGGTDLPDAAYAWDYGDGTTGTGATAAHTYTLAGKFPVTLTVTDGSFDRVVRRTITVTGVAPTAAFTFTPNGAASGTTVAFDGSGSRDSDGTIASYRWDFNDGTTATGATASHAYAAAGSYQVKLTVTDDDGTTGSTSKTVTVTAPSTGNPPDNNTNTNPPANTNTNTNPTPSPGTGTTPTIRVTLPGGGRTTSPGDGRITAQSAGTLKLTLGALSVDARKGTLKLAASCPAGTSGCSGTLRIVVNAKGGKTLATIHYNVAAGRKGTLSVRLSAAGFKALKKSRSLKVKVTTGSGATAKTATATLKLAKAKH